MLMIPQALPARDFDGSFSEARDAVYDQSLTVGETRVLIDKSRQTIRSISDEGQRLYWLARVEALAGYLELHTAENGRAAASHYEKSRSLAEEAIGLEEFSEGYRLVAEAIGNLSSIRRGGYALFNGPRVPVLARKALDLDPGNSKAMILLGSSEIYTPRIFGGNPAQGIKWMEMALQLGEPDRGDRFNAYSGIGVALARLKRYDEARRYFLHSLSVFPNNRFVRQELQKLP
jgi:tetratricopeptide (TPR) repeat protein